MSEAVSANTGAKLQSEMRQLRKIRAFLRYERIANCSERVAAEIKERKF